MTKCLPCVVHQNGLTKEEKEMLYELLSSTKDSQSLEEAFFLPMMTLMVKTVTKRKEIPSTGGDDGTLDIEFKRYVKVYKKFVLLLKGEVNG